MGATSTEGVGSGASEKPSINDLAIWANGPQILYSGLAESEDSEIISPPSTIGSVTLPVPLPGLAEDYCVILTTLNGGAAYIIDMDDDDLDGDDEDDHFVGFSFYTESACTVMYIVVQVGIRPSIPT